MNTRPLLLVLVIFAQCFTEGNTRKIVCSNIFQGGACGCYESMRIVVGKMSPYSQLTAIVRVTHNDIDFENELNQADGKLVIVDFFHSQLFPFPPGMISCINKLAENYQETVVWILVDGYKCVMASNSVLRLSLYPTYVFLTKTEEHCRFHGMDNGKKDCALIEKKIQELLGQTKVQVVVEDDDLNEKLNDAGSKLVMVVFADNNLSDSDHNEIVSDLEKFAKTHEENMVIIEAHVNRCPKGVRRYNVLESSRPAFVFIKNTETMSVIRVEKYAKENIEAEIKKLLTQY